MGTLTKCKDNGPVMPYQLAWLDADRVCFVRVWGDFAMHDIRHANVDVCHLLNEASDALHFMVNVTGVTDFPQMASEILNATTALAHRKLGWLVVYGIQRPLIEMLLLSLARAVPFRCKIAQSAEEALGILIEQDPAISAPVAYQNLKAIVD